MKRSTLLIALIGFGAALLLAIVFHQATDRPLSSQPVQTGQSAVQPSDSPASRSVFGTNLAGIADWSSQMPFVDAFKSSREWITQCDDSEPDCREEWSTKEEDQLDLDEYGWVRSLPEPTDALEYTRVGTLLFRGVDDYPGGEYIVLYDGQGTLRYDFDAELQETASSPGRDVINVTPSGEGIFIQITATDPENYIRNIHVVPAEYEDSFEQQPFNPVFIEKTQPFSVLRFMDWMRTNDSEQQEWADRPQLDDANYVPHGVPVELIVDFANRLGQAPWFTMPHQATDAYVREFAQIVKQQLDPELDIYVELSNEVWNGQFDQNDYAVEQGRQLNVGKGDPEKGHMWYGKRTAEVLQIWDEVFAEDSDRLIGILGAQAANSWTAEKSLEYLRSAGLSNADAGIDAIAIAPYFGLPLSDDSVQQDLERWAQDGEETALTQLFTELTEGGALSEGHPGGALQRTFDRVADYIELAQAEGLALVAYEGGQHLAPLHNGMENNRAIVDLFIAANRDPRMGEVYRLYLDRWREEVGSLFVHFSDISAPGKWGSWGALENVYQESSPKYDALMVTIQGAEPAE
ncbi:MAG: hypothetical protein WBA10_19920 [Elainellaceae cyanobacterium]